MFDASLWLGLDHHAGKRLALADAVPQGLTPHRGRRTWARQEHDPRDGIY